MQQSIKQFLASENIFIISTCSIAIGLYFPHFPLLMSGGAVLLFISGLLKKNLKATLSNKYFLLVTSLFLLMIISLPYTTQIQDWISETQRKLSFLLIAFGMTANLAFVNKKTASNIFLAFLATTLSVAITTFINYLLHYDELNQKILESQGLPIITGISHITFGILSSFAIGVSIFLYKNSSKIFNHKLLKNQYIYAISGCILFVIFHFIASRTGWVALYSALFAIILREIIVSKKIIFGLILFGSMILSPVIAFQFSTAFHNKITNTIDDVTRYMTGDYIGFYSVSMRFEAWKVSYQLFKAHPILGVGSADLGSMMQPQYDKIGTSDFARVYESHNQFLEYMACNGIIGLLCLLSIFILLGIRSGLKSMLSLYFFSMMFGAFIFESFLEIQVGIAFFSLFYILLNQLKEKNEL